MGFSFDFWSRWISAGFDYRQSVSYPTEAFLFLVWFINLFLYL